MNELLHDHLLSFFTFQMHQGFRIPLYAFVLRQQKVNNYQLYNCINSLQIAMSYISITIQIPYEKKITIHLLNRESRKNYYA